jgi:hypothetical protein
MPSQDPTAAISPLLTFTTVVVVLALARLNRGKKRMVIPDYRRGVLFKDGSFVKVLEPGSYRVATLVQDPHLAATATRDQIKDALAILRDQMRTVLSQQISDLSPGGPAKLAETIAAAANKELRKIGMRAAGTEVTEFWCAPTPTTAFSAPTTVQ